MVNIVWEDYYDRNYTSTNCDRGIPRNNKLKNLLGLSSPYWNITVYMNMTLHPAIAPKPVIMNINH